MFKEKISKDIFPKVKLVERNWGLHVLIVEKSKCVIPYMFFFLFPSATDTNVKC